jgi:hypothetical protein
VPFYFLNISVSLNPSFEEESQLTLEARHKINKLPIKKKEEISPKTSKMYVLGV